MYIVPTLDIMAEAKSVKLSVPRDFGDSVALHPPPILTTDFDSDRGGSGFDKTRQ